MKFNETCESCTSFMMFDGVVKTLFYLMCGLKSFFETRMRSLCKLCMHSINLCVYVSSKVLFCFLCVCAIFLKNEEVYTSFTKLKGILLVFGVCLSLKESSHLCVDDFLKWARGLHKLCQAQKVFLDFFGLCVNLKAILFLFLCVAPYRLFFYCYGFMT